MGGGGKRYIIYIVLCYYFLKKIGKILKILIFLLPFTSTNTGDTKGSDEGAHKDDTTKHHYSHFQSG